MRLIDCRLMEIKSFNIEHGFQPTNALFYIVEGSFSLEAEGKCYTITKGDLVSFPTDMEFKRHMIEPIKLYNIRYESNEHIPRGRLDIKNHNRLLATISYMTKLSLILNTDTELMNHYLSDIFTQIKTEQLLDNIFPDSIVADAARLFEKTIDKKISLAETATALGVSVTGLIGHFKKATGITPMRYLSAMRIKKAETLLCASDYSLSQIAEKCGYDNAFYFSTAFKKEKGMSPTAYRQKYGI